MRSKLPAAAAREDGTSTPNRLSPSLVISAVFAAVLSTFFFVPWWPEQPSAGLDPSWQYAVNEMVARHLVFGRNFIFSFGPFGAVYTGQYHPATDALMLTGSILVAVALCAGFVMLVWPRRIYLLLLLPIVIAEPLVRDVVLMALPFLLLLVVFRLSRPRESRLYAPLSGGALLCVVLLSSAVGVLPLIKGTFLALVVVEGGVAVLMAFVAGQRTLALSILFFAIVALCIGWVAAGQPLTALPRFFWAQGQIIAGYSQAMSLQSRYRQLLYWGVPAAVIAGFFYACITRRGGLAGWLVFLGFAFYLFVAFKAGFVRGGGHVLISGEAFLFVGAFLAAVLEPWPAIVVAVIACLGWVAIEGSAINLSAVPILARIENAARRSVDGITTRIGSPGALPAAFAQANAAIRAASPLPTVTGTVDLYPDNLALLFATGMKRDGRPIIQSYSAYTPALMEANAGHVLGNEAPANIFFAVEPIDGRLPALEDALSWPLLLSRYSIVGLSGNYLQMVKSAYPAPVSDGPAVRIAVRLNEWIDVPAHDGLLWARIDMRPTVLGKLVLAAFKLPGVSIELRLADGRTGRYRYIPEMGRAGFLLSPAVGSTLDFALMAGGQDKAAEVRQFRLVTPAVGLWSRRVLLSFRKLDMPSQHGVRDLVLTKPSPPPEFLSAGEIDRVEDCSLDTIGGRPFGSLKEPVLPNDDALDVTGWTAPAAQRGIGPDETWIALESANGERRFYRASAVPHPNVLAYFNQPKMNEPGFSADLDLLGLSGIQKLTIYSTRADEAFRCSTQTILQLPPSNSDTVGSSRK